jgi:L-2,4-diaminobutyric acid acetyltransferase
LIESLLLSEQPTGMVAASTVEFVPLRAEHGQALHALVASCKPLDENSLYCNLLQASHFGATSMGAWQQASLGLEPQLIGSITGYRLPNDPHTLFVWQVAVDKQARGQGLGLQLLSHLLAHLLTNQSQTPVTHLQTSITTNNTASWALFKRFAKQLAAPTRTDVLFEHSAHFGGSAPTEHVLTVGPIAPGALANSTHASAVDAQEHANSRAMPELSPG